VAADATTGSGAGTQRQQQPTRHRALPVCWQLPAQEAGSCRRNRRRPHHFVGDRQLAAIRLLRRLDELHLLRRQHHLARLAKLLQRWKDGCRASVCVCVWGGGGHSRSSGHARVWCAPRSGRGTRHERTFGQRPNAAVRQRGPELHPAAARRLLLLLMAMLVVVCCAASGARSGACALAHRTRHPARMRQVGARWFNTWLHGGWGVGPCPGQATRKGDGHGPGSCCQTIQLMPPH
jgi:hypothetical protein